MNKTFYHGSSSVCDINSLLVPPSVSKVISEKGRKKNLDRIFFTEDIGLAKIYAGRAAKSLGGEPRLYRVVMPVDPVCMKEDQGASVWHASWAFVEVIQ